MCDFVGGQVIVTRPRGDGPAARVALAALGAVSERYGAGPLQSLDNLMEQPPPSVREREGHGRKSEHKSEFFRPPFYVELAKVRAGEELSFVDELRGIYLDFALSDTKAIADLVNNRNQQLHTSPNWRLHLAAGTPEAVSDPFTISSNHSAYLKQIGLDRAKPNEAAGVTVAVLDNGFDNKFWPAAPTPSPVAASQDLISGDASTSGHGTLVAALIASSAPGANVVPIRMAGKESTEWDALHALARAVQLGAQIVTFAYRQILAVDNPCKRCGLVRTAARSEVFAKMVDWASDGGSRAILAAAGNDGIGSVARPAAYRGAIPIAALASSGNALWSLSNWDGSAKLDVLALPGEDVASGTSGSPYSGTSFATAYAAALYAVAMGRNSIFDASIISKVLTASSSGTVSNATIPVLN
jgi:hypothetical protein